MSGCTQGFYKKWADREVFGILKKKSSSVAGADDDVLQSITPPPPVNLAELEKQADAADFLGERAFVEQGARVLSLPDALNFAVHRNRTYLTRKERVYRSALALTETRQRFGPIADGRGSVSVAEAQRHQASVNDFVRTSSLSTDGRVGLTYLMKTGARLAMDLSTDFTRLFTGQASRVSDSLAAVTLTQPLLRGAGVLVAAEPLRQDERDVLYEIRDFTQYRKTFVVDITRQFLRTLQAREQARNRYIAYKASLGSLERDRALAEANLRSQSQLKQIEQGSITYERQWITAIRNYEDALDDLKITLGLPVTEKLVLDPDELKKLEVIDPEGNLEAMIDTALITRLDLFNQRDRVYDTQRRVKIAHQATYPAVNALAGYSIGSPSVPNPTNSNTSNASLGLNHRQRTLQGGLDIDLNLNTLPERNDLRAAQIDEQAAQRALELAEEELRGTIRADWRALQVARRQYDLAVKGLELSQKRLEIEEALMAEGQGTARDIVESQDRLIVARDLVISTMIDHNLARLQLWTDMGVLFIRKDASWADVLKQEKPRGNS
ncbi:MAG: TolC family protein [Prosthecobacter sp.]|nr:TolC family protein [Prosthecobacter sp.]